MKALDLFGYQPSLYYDKKKSFKTYTGLAATIVYVGLTAIILLLSLLEIFNRSKPFVFQSSIIDNSPSVFELTSDNFYFAYSVASADSQYFIDESIYTVSLFQVEAELDEVGNYAQAFKKIPLVNCSKVDTTLANSVFDLVPKSILYCHIPTETLKIEGRYGNKIYKNIQLMVQKCDPQTSKIPCKSEEEIAAKLEGGFFGFYFSDSTFEPTNPSVPFKKFSAAYFTNVNASTTKFLHIQLSKNIAFTDVGLIFEDTEEIVDFSVEDYNETSTSIKGNNIVETYIYYSNRRNEYNRSYTKLQRATADAGAVAKFLFIVLKYVVWFFARESFLVDIFSKYGENKADKGNNTFCSVNNYTGISVLPKKPSLEKVRKQAPEGLKGCFNRKRSKQMERIREKVSEKTDLIYLINKHLELELIKEVLFTAQEKLIIDELQAHRTGLVNFFDRSKTVFDKKKNTKECLRHIENASSERKSPKHRLFEIIGITN